MYINYDLNIVNGYDVLYIYRNDVLVAQYTGEVSGQLTLDDIITTDTIKLRYIKNASTSLVDEKVNLEFVAVTSTVDVLTTEIRDDVQEYLDDVYKKKPAGIAITPMDVEYIRPQLVIKVYMDQNDLRYSTTGDSIKVFLADLYNRDNFKIGEPVYKSHISKDILSNFNYINYLEILSLQYEVDGAIKPNKTQFVELLIDNMTINVVPYES